MEKTIYCPSCNRRVAAYDGKSSINVVTICQKCHKQVVYYVDIDEVAIKEIPPRNTSSGKTFC